MADKKQLDENDLRALGVSARNNRDEYNQAWPDPSVLEKIPVPEEYPVNYLTVEIKVPEFTSRCPVTGQPDFGKIEIEYNPDKWMVESKSLKLYILGFRNFGEFHESCVMRICHDLGRLLDPDSLTVCGEFYPRGGISIYPMASWVKEEGSPRLF